MITWDSLSKPWQVSFELAWKAYCAGSVPVGAVVTDRGGEILSVGRNRIRESFCEDEKQIYGNQLAHAELNALLATDFDVIDPHTCVLYTTSEPCPLCVGAICMAGIKEVHYASRDVWSGSAELFEATGYLRRKQISLIGPQDPDFETILQAIVVEYALRYGFADTAAFLKAWENAASNAVRVGRLLHASGALSRMCNNGEPASAVLVALLEYHKER
jgi:tRNA(adenine34) deaminase